MSAETKAWICIADDCFNVMPQLHKKLMLAAVHAISSSLNPSLLTSFNHC